MRYVAYICVHDSVVTLTAYVYEAHRERVGSLMGKAFFALVLTFFPFLSMLQ